MLIESEVPRATFSFSDSVTGSELRKLLYSWSWLTAVEGYRVTSAKAKAHSAKAHSPKSRGESHRQRLVFPAAVCEKTHKELPTREARLSLGVQDFY